MGRTTALKPQAARIWNFGGQSGRIDLDDGDSGKCEGLVEDRPLLPINSVDL